MEGLRGVGRPYRLEHPQSVHETWRETSTIYVALIDSGEPRTADDFSLFNATRLPPSNGSRPPRELGKLCIDVCEIEERYRKRANTSYVAQKALEGVSYEA